MAVTTTPVFPQKFTRYAARIGNGTASAWKFMESGKGVYTSADGTKIVSLAAASTDTSARNVQLAVARKITATVTIATPAVVSAAMDVVAGDMVLFTTTDALPSGMTAGTTYFVISTGLTAATSFQFAATAGGTAINTTGTQNGTHTLWRISPKATIPVPASSGTTGTVVTVDFINNAFAPPIAIDNDGQKYIGLDANTALAARSLATVTADTVINIGGLGCDFS